MIEGWRTPSASQDDAVEWIEDDSALEPAPAISVAWPRTLAIAVVGLAALAWLAFAGWAIGGIARDSADPASLLLPIGAALVPLVLAVQLWRILRRSQAAAERQIATAQLFATTVAERLDRAAAGFTARVRDGSDQLEERADRWHRLSAGLEDRGAVLSGALDRGLAAMDERLDRLDTIAAAARRDLAAVLVGLPRAEAKTRELVGSLRDAGLTAHEGANALDAQVGLLRHRAMEADELASAAATRLTAQLTQLVDAGEAAGERLTGTADAANTALDQLVERSEVALERAAGRITERGAAMSANVEEAARALDEANDRATAQMAARLDFLDERLRAVADRIAAGDIQVEEQVAALDQRVVALGDTLADLRERSAQDAERFQAALRRMDEQADGLNARIGSGDEAMTFALGRAESLLGALDAAARELDETLPASFGRFERLAGEGFERLALAMPELERFHALTEEAALRIAASGSSLASDREQAEIALGALDGRLSAAREQIDGLHAVASATATELADLETQRVPRLSTALAQAREAADTLGDAAARAVDEAIAPARERMEAEVTGPLAEAVDDTLRRQAEIASTVAAEAVETVQRAAGQLQDELQRIEDTGRRIAERGDGVLALVRQEGEAGFSRRVALLLEALNSAAIDVAKVLSNDVSDTAWAAYLKGDRGAFTRRAVRLLDAGEAREILRTYEEDGEFRGQVNRYIHDFEALLRTVLADANGAPMAVTLLSSDNGKLYVALAQAIERLRD